MLSWIIAIIVGGVAGWIASMIMGRDASMGIFWNIIVGLIGSLIGNWVGNAFFGVGGPIGEFSLTGFIVAIVGAEPDWRWPAGSPPIWFSADACANHIRLMH